MRPPARVRVMSFSTTSDRNTNVPVRKAKEKTAASQRRIADHLAAAFSSYLQQGIQQAVFSTFHVLVMTSRFCFHAEHAQFCILDAPGLNLDFCFQHEQLSIGADEIKRKIAVWQQMDLHLAADDISLCYKLHDYKHLVNSYPQSPLTLFSPLLRRL